MALKNSCKQIFDFFSILGNLGVSKNSKKPPKNSPKFNFSGFSADMNEILCKIGCLSPKTKSEVIFWNSEKGAHGREGVHRIFQKFCLSNDFDEIYY